MDYQLSVTWLIIHQLAHVRKDSQEILSIIVTSNVRNFLRNLIDFSIFFFIFIIKIIQFLFFSFLFLILLNLAIEELSKPVDPCNPSPCGPNAVCTDGSCSCLSDYQGDPYIGCRPECILNNDCPLSRACIRNKCVDPCPGTCGENAQCNVYNHIPMCSCLPGMTGNAFLSCRPSRGMCRFVDCIIDIKFKDSFFFNIINFRPRRSL